MKAYEKMHSEFTLRRSEAKSPSLCDKLDHAIGLTEKSRMCLDQLAEQRDLLIIGISNDFSSQEKL